MYTTNAHFIALSIYKDKMRLYFNPASITGWCSVTHFQRYIQILQKTQLKKKTHQLKCVPNLTKTKLNHLERNNLNLKLDGFKFPLKTHYIAS